MNICKVFQEIYKNKFELNELNIAEVGSRGKNMTCRYRITVQEEMQNVKFSYYDAAVYDAVYTLYKTNYSKFTLTDLLRVMSGDEKVRFYCTKSRIQKREQKLRDSLEKLRNTTIAIDYSEEVQRRNIQDEKGKPLETKRTKISGAGTGNSGRDQKGGTQEKTRNRNICGKNCRSKMIYDIISTANRERRREGVECVRENTPDSN